MSTRYADLESLRRKRFLWTIARVTLKRRVRSTYVPFNFNPSHSYGKSWKLSVFLYCPWAPLHRLLLKLLNSNSSAAVPVLRAADWNCSEAFEIPAFHAALGPSFPFSDRDPPVQN